MSLTKELGRFISLIWGQGASIRSKILTACALTLLMCLVSMGLPLLYSAMIQQLSDQSLPQASLIPLVLLGYGLLWTVSQLIEQVRSILSAHILEGSARILSLKLFDHLHALSSRFHLDRKTGAVINAIDRAQFGLESLFWGLFLFAIPIMIEMALILILLIYWYGIICGIIILIFIGAYISLNMRALEKTTTLHTQYNDKRAQASAKLLDSLLNAETVRYFSNQQFDHDQCDRLLQEQEQIGITKYRTEAILHIAQLLVIGGGITAVTWLSGTCVISNTITIGEFVLINGYLLQLISPLRGFAYVMQQIRKGLQDMAAVNELLALQPEITDAPHASSLNGENAIIVFEKVSFGYDPLRPILKDISFTVPAGKTVAIVGASGAGKSTISRLLFRLYEVTAGSIHINGQDIREVTQASLHKSLGIVPQDTILFNDTLAYNIAYGNPHAEKSAVEQAARAAQLDHFIAQLPEGYQTPVGERGLKLSGGEKQRVAIARVLLKNPSIYIFDEATSALDSHTEQEILRTMQTVSFGATTLIIAHRLSTVIHADLILVLDQGVIVEQGTHAELLAQQKQYASLWHKQIQKMPE